ncbi:stage III sporulation protein AG [Marininema mesophilum]|uniref:Stage III sporulation protein AG n=1 Tax=Marininema mesophilum TaxID=1048340 RepID=A0A1H2UC24_9BACL|nr:stage III sporulation protein AG [Marininema mesophilum]SDW53448.1 stage III sporulation protein AG [Marininema mesophilum]
MIKRLVDRIEAALGAGANGEGKVSTFRWLLILGCLGVGIMIVSSFFADRNQGLPTSGLPGKEKQEASSTAQWDKGSGELSMKEYEAMYESELSDMLANVIGVKEVTVMVNLDSSEEEVYQRDRQSQEQVTKETDTRGGNRQIRQSDQDEKVVLQRKGDGEEVPIVVKKVKPYVRGVLVVARGVENLQVKAAIIEAVQRVLDVPIHRISVLPKG